MIHEHMIVWQRAADAREVGELTQSMPFPKIGEWCHRTTTMIDGRILVLYYDQSDKCWLYHILPQP